MSANVSESGAPCAPSVRVEPEPRTDPARAPPVGTSSPRRAGKLAPSTPTLQTWSEWARKAVDQTLLFSLRENAIAKEPGLSYLERWRCVSRLGRFNGGLDSF